MKQIKPALSLLFAIILSCNSSLASDTTSIHIKAVLVMINTQTNKINALQNSQYRNKLAEVKKDAIGQKNAMMLDFKDNFDYCPVFYFNDTDIDKVLNKQFENVLTDSSGKTANNPIASTDTNYLIVYNGYPIEQSRRTKMVTDSNKYAANSDAPYGKGLIICNYKLLQIGYLYNFGYHEYYMKIFQKKLLKYSYFSKHFDINYFPNAFVLNELIHNPKKIHKHHEGLFMQ